MMMVKPGQGMSIRKQCAAVKVPVSSYYCRPKPPGAAPVPNLLEGDMPAAPNRIWASNLTQMRVDRGMMHVAIIIDACSRLIVGIRLSNTPDAALCLKAFAHACSHYGCSVVFHSDKGAQFTSRCFRDGLRRHGIKQSMTGCHGWKDNVFAERVIWSLKNECTRLRDLETGSQIRAALLEFVAYYNFVRLHSKLQGRTPAEAHGLSRKKNQQATWTLRLRTSDAAINSFSLNYPKCAIAIQLYSS